MKLRERIALIRAGYSKAEIAEIEAAETLDQEEEEPETEDPETEDPETEDPEPDPNLQRIKDLEDQIKKLQQANVEKDQDIPEEKSIDKLLQEIIY